VSGWLAVLDTYLYYKTHLNSRTYFTAVSRVRAATLYGALVVTLAMSL